MGQLVNFPTERRQLEIKFNENLPQEHDFFTYAAYTKAYRRNAKNKTVFTWGFYIGIAITAVMSLVILYTHLIPFTFIFTSLFIVSLFATIIPTIYPSKFFLTKDEVPFMEYHDWVEYEQIKLRALNSPVNKDTDYVTERIINMGELKAKNIETKNKLSTALDRYFGKSNNY